MTGHFIEMARYNLWANRRLYDDAAIVSEDGLHRDVGVYFGSLFATLEHILKVDRAWLHLLGGGVLADLARSVPATDFVELRRWRVAEDAAIEACVSAVDAAWLDMLFEFRSSLPSWAGMTYRGTRASTLTHLFNHQTHHRGQAHTALSLLGVEPSALDILVKGMLGE